MGKKRSRDEDPSLAVLQAQAEELQGHINKKLKELEESDSDSVDSSQEAILGGKSELKGFSSGGKLTREVRQTVHVDWVYAINSC